MLRSILDGINFFIDLIVSLSRLVVSFVSGIIDLIGIVITLPEELPILIGWLPPAVFALVVGLVTISIIKLVIGRQG